MKKILGTFMLLMPLVALLSCNSSDDDQQQFDIELNQFNHIHNTLSDEVGVSSGVMNLHLDFSKSSSVRISQAVGMAELTSPFTITSGDISAKNETASSLFTYSYPSLQSGGHNLTGLTGAYDLLSGLNYLSYIVDGTFRVVSTTSLIFPYSTTRVLKDEKESINTQKSMYQFVLDTSTQKAKMAIYNFQLTPTGESIEMLALEGFDYEVTPEGYHFTSAEHNVAPYSFSAMDFTVSDNCQSISGSYKVDEFDVQVSGKMFKRIITL